MTPEIIASASAIGMQIAQVTAQSWDRSNFSWMALTTGDCREPNSATLYAPTAKKPTYPRSSRPARPITTFRPSAMST